MRVDYVQNQALERVGPSEWRRAFAPLTPADDFGFPPPVPISKRIFDKVFAVGALIFFAPFMLTVAALLLLREGGPILFVQERVGHGGRLFKCLKFRTMAVNADAQLAELLDRDPAARAEWDATRKLRNDPRISCMGRLLRKTSLDELPQFFNVLSGDMSIVGPRPIVSEEAVFYREHFIEYKSVRPGLTGAWQVSGRSNTTYDERVALDVGYVRNWSFRTDLGIVARTVNAVLWQSGAR